VMCVCLCVCICEFVYEGLCGFCSVLQCVAVCCSVAVMYTRGFVGAAVCCNVMQCVAVCCVCCSVLRVLQCVAVCCKSDVVCCRYEHGGMGWTDCTHSLVYIIATLQHTATHCHTLQYTAT